MKKDPKVKFPTCSQFVSKHLFDMVAKTMDKYIQPLLAKCESTSITFNLLMSRIGYNTFCLIMNFIDDTWQLHHVTIGLFEAPKTIGATLAEIVKPLLAQYKFIKKIITYMKDEGNNLNTLASTFLQVVNYELLQLTSPYVGACFGHTVSKTCQYVISNDKICVGMTQMLLRNAQLAL